MQIDIHRVSCSVMLPDNILKPRDGVFEVSRTTKGEGRLRENRNHDGVELANGCRNKVRVGQIGFRDVLIRANQILNGHLTIEDFFNCLNLPTLGLGEALNTTEIEQSQ